MDHRKYWFCSLILTCDALQEDPDPNLFATEVRNCAGSSVTLDIWSAKVFWSLFSKWKQHRF